MIDTFSKALTDRENEVMELKRDCKKAQIDIESLNTANKQLQQDVQHQASLYQQLQAQFIQQSERHEEVVQNLQNKF